MTFFRKVIHSELLIYEVEKRPALYDMSSPEFRDKNVREKLWEEVCEALISDWCELTPIEKCAKATEMQKRWKGLRDCFRREIINQKTTPPEIEAKRRKYIYFDQLLFLLPTMKEYQTTFNSSPPREVDDAVEKVIKNSPPSSTRSSRSVKRQRKSFEMEPLIMQQEISKPQEEEVDDDKAFLLSLLPTLRKFNENQKFTVRIEIMNTIRKVQAESKSCK